MWRRWNYQDASSGHPGMMDEDLDDRYLETIHEVESLRSGRSSVAAALPDLPFRAVPPLNEIHPAFRHSVASSTYSDHAPDLPRAEPDRRESTGQSEVSPVSTPRSSVNFAASDTSLVSPIESTFTIPPRAPYSDLSQKSAIPRPVPLGTKDMPGARPKKENTKWDKYTGEQTNDATGLPAHAPKPGTAPPVEMQFPNLKERTKEILAGLRDRDTNKKAPWGRQPPPVAADPLDVPAQRKVPWKGASGRTPLVDPVQNNPSARKGPLHPQRNVSKMNPAEDQARTMTPEGIRYESIPAPPMARSISPEKLPNLAYQPVQQPSPISSSPPKGPSIRMVASQESIKPVAPLKAKTPRTMSPTEAQNVASLESPFHSPYPAQSVSENENIIPRLKDAPQPKYNFGRSSPETPEMKLPRKPVHENSQNLGTSHLQHEPESRFSWTTYATTVNDSPGSMAPAHMTSSPVPPMPPLSAPIVIRKRPVSTTQDAHFYSDKAANNSRASIISRKPVASERDRSASIMSVSKSLPPTPVEMEAGDKISTLEARMEDLEMRKRNNKKLNWEMNESLRRNAVNYDMRKRKEVEKAIANLALEWDEITREEHEVGLKLHRSQKKRDKNDCYENPTGLWIKRVTS